MSKFRKLLVAAGILAIPAVAFAAVTGSSGSCCGAKSPCCEPKAACCEQAVGDKQITCPITGETINESECPLCKGQK
jgi:uncharacterized protein (DUF779 family)